MLSIMYAIITYTWEKRLEGTLPGWEQQVALEGGTRESIIS